MVQPLLLKFERGVVMNKIFNGTPHAIKVVDPSTATFNPQLRKWVSECPTYLNIIEPSGTLLNASIKNVRMPDVVGLPCFDKEIIGCSDFPQGYDVVIVSALYANAYRSVNGSFADSMYTVSDPVYTPDGNSFVGCLGIARAF